MKVSVDDVELFTISDVQKKVIMNDVMSDIFEADMRRRLFYIINERYKASLKKLKEDWIPKLQASGMESIPLNDDALATIIFDHPEYKDRKTRQDEADLIQKQKIEDLRKKLEEEAALKNGSNNT